MTRTLLPFILLFVLLKNTATQSTENSATSSQNAHHRQKRLFWVTNDGRLVLPPGTILSIVPTLSMPLVRYPPYGFQSNFTMSFPFSIYFDQLGLSDNESPFGVIPPILSRSLKSRDAGVALSDFIASFIKHRMDKRETPPEVPKHAFHGGERALLYGMAEDMLSNFGVNGKACLLRAICEVQGHPLNNFGFIGEVLRLFFTASKSPFAELMDDYVVAENKGKLHGECWPYFKACPKSMFLPSSNKYKKDSVHDESEPDFDDNSNKISRKFDQDTVKNEFPRNFDQDTMKNEFPRNFDQDTPKRTPTRNIKRTIDPTDSAM